MRRTRCVLTAILAVIALLVTACGGGGGETTTTADQTEVAGAVDERTEEQAGEEEVAEEQVRDEEITEEEVAEEERWQETPLAQFMGWGQSPEDDAAYWQEQDRKRQELVSECMAEQGFAWVPVDYSQFEEFGHDPFADLTREEFIEQYGFGISTMFDLEQEMPPPDFEFVDPNWEMYESLSDAEKEAWDRTLHGEPMEWDETDPRFDPTSDEFDPEVMMPQGCWGEAERALGDYQRNLAWMEFESEFSSLWQQIENDPRMVEAQTEWSTCMAGQGYTLTSQEDMWMDLEERMMPIWEAQDPFANMPPEEIEPILEDMTPEEQDEFFRQAQQLTPELQARLDEVKEYELALAMADYECNKQADIDDVRFEVQIEHERAFIEEHGERLAELRELEGR